MGGGGDGGGGLGGGFRGGGDGGEIGAGGGGEAGEAGGGEGGGDDTTTPSVRPFDVNSDPMAHPVSHVSSLAPNKEEHS